VTRRLTLAFACAAAVAVAAAAQTPSATDLKTLIVDLGSLEYPVRTRAARQIRRAAEADAVPALSAAVRTATDEYVRYRAFVLLSSFSDRAAGELARAVLRDRNDRLRQVAYQWLERHPDPQLTTTLLGLLQTEQAEFVRPALLGALSALGDNASVQRVLIAETGRGLDIFRSAVIESLGLHRAVYATDAIVAVAQLEGPLQDDAVLALGRIGGTKARSVLTMLTSSTGDIALTARAGLCIIGDSCELAVRTLAEAAAAPRAATSRIRAAVAGLSAIASVGESSALDALSGLASRGDTVRDEASIALAGAAVRVPEPVLKWLDAPPEDTRRAVLGLLKDGFDALEEDFGEEQFYAMARATYWKSPEGSPTRTLMAAVIDALEF
jgi:hypothetical protein